MQILTDEPHELCFGCVYFPSNLPRHAYGQEDWDMLQARQCSFEHDPGGMDCLATRKTSCAIVTLAPNQSATE